MSRPRTGRGSAASDLDRGADGRRAERRGRPATPAREPSGGDLGAQPARSRRRSGAVARAPCAGPAPSGAGGHTAAVRGAAHSRAPLRLDQPADLGSHFSNDGVEVLQVLDGPELLFREAATLTVAALNAAHSRPRFIRLGCQVAAMDVGDLDKLPRSLPRVTVMQEPTRCRQGCRAMTPCSVGRQVRALVDGVRSASTMTRIRVAGRDDHRVPVAAPVRRRCPGRGQRLVGHLAARRARQGPVDHRPAGHHRRRARCPAGCGRSATPAPPPRRRAPPQQGTRRVRARSGPRRWRTPRRTGHPGSPRLRACRLRSRRCPQQRRRWSRQRRTTHRTTSPESSAASPPQPRRRSCCTTRIAQPGSPGPITGG